MIYIRTMIAVDTEHVVAVTTGTKHLAAAAILKTRILRAYRNLKTIAVQMI